jgi:hypothetical protein
MTHIIYHPVQLCLSMYYERLLAHYNGLSVSYIKYSRISAWFQVSFLHIIQTRVSKYTHVYILFCVLVFRYVTIKTCNLIISIYLSIILVLLPYIYHINRWISSLERLVALYYVARWINLYFCEFWSLQWSSKSMDLPLSLAASSAMHFICLNF